jgi:tRNA(Ile)-lysidine synthase
MAAGVRETLADALADHAARLGQPRRLLVGYSGGLDSSLLLALCHDLEPSRTSAIHVDHGYAAESAEWQHHCRGVCSRLGVPLVVRELGLSAPVSEGAARSARYASFGSLTGPGDLLLLAHHADDQAETVLLHVLQGRGVFGMPASRPLGGGHLLRPFLPLSRRALADEARRLGIAWVEDAGNLDVSFDRNLLRQQVLPMLLGRFPGLPARLARLADRSAARERLLAASAGIARGPLDLIRLARARDAMEQVVLLRLWLKVNELPETGDSALESFAGQLTTSTGHQPELRLDGGALRRYRDAVHFVPDVAPAWVERTLSVPDEVTLPQGTLTVTAAGSGPRPEGPLVLRCYGAPGQTSSRLLLKRRGRERAVRELLRAAGVPPWQRSGYPLLYDDVGLLAVPDVAVRDGAVAEEGAIAIGWRPSAPAAGADR